VYKIHCEVLQKQIWEKVGLLATDKMFEERKNRSEEEKKRGRE